jgi:hypothetical protein
VLPLLLLLLPLQLLLLLLLDSVSECYTSVATRYRDKPRTSQPFTDDHLFGCLIFVRCTTGTATA